MAFAPVALFCYNRIDTLQQTVNALLANPLAGESELFIFADGAKGERDQNKVAEVRKYIRTIQGFKNVVIKEAESNRGLANSIIAGVTEVVNSYGKIIVLEDDIVTAPYFLKWMNDALDLYENDDRVAGIHAWTPPQIFGERPDTYFIREVGCWGWATWKRGWDLFEADGSKLLKEFNSRKMIRNFNIYSSYPYYQMLKNQVAGLVDSWAIRWYASVFLKGKLGLQPGKSLVANVGCQTGTHFDTTSKIPTDRIARYAPVLENLPVRCDEDVLQRVYGNYNILAYTPSAVGQFLFCFQPGGWAYLKKIAAEKKRKILTAGKKLLRSILPAGIQGFIHEKRRCWRYERLCDNFQEAAGYAGSYEAPQIIEKVFSATEQVINGFADHEQDSVLFYEKKCNYPLVSSLLQAAMKCGELHVLDFGGALGSTFWQHREILKSAVGNLSWHIVEQKTFFDASKKLIYDEPLYFHETIDDVLKKQKINVVLFSSVLQYLEDPEFILDRVKNVEFMIIDRHPEFVDRKECGFAVQYVKEPVYDASYPVRIWGRDELENMLKLLFYAADTWSCAADGVACISDKGGKNLQVHNKGLFLVRRKMPELKGKLS